MAAEGEYNMPYANFIPGLIYFHGQSSGSFRDSTYHEEDPYFWPAADWHPYPGIPHIMCANYPGVQVDMAKAQHFFTRCIAHCDNEECPIASASSVLARAESLAFLGSIFIWVLGKDSDSDSTTSSDSESSLDLNPLRARGVAYLVEAAQSCDVDPIMNEFPKYLPANQLKLKIN